MTIPASTRYGRKMRALYGDAFRRRYNERRRIRRSLVPIEVRRARRAAWDLTTKMRRCGVAA